MKTVRPISIAGGGLAGLTLGIALRQRGLPVRIWEAGGYPRHRVCGEFICGGGVEVLRRLGLHSKLLRAGAVEARSALFCTAGRCYRPKQLPCAAFCLSRYSLDGLLADEFRLLGGELHERNRFTGADYGAGVVRATGRRAAVASGSRGWIGLKAHARGVSLAADVEMHLVGRCYVGLCRLAGGVVNVCGLFAVSGAVPRLTECWQEFLRGPEGSLLRGRLEFAEFEESSFCAVSGLNLSPVRAGRRSECCVGDAVTMISPVTGNGMSMAFESAAWAVSPLAAYGCGELSWEEARQAIAQRCDAGFARRLWWARRLQWLLLRPATGQVLLALGERWDWMWRAWFGRTR